MDSNYSTFVVNSNDLNSCFTLVSWTCSSCGQIIYGNMTHVCPNVIPQMKPHCCPVCRGKGRVQFDPEQPYARQNNAEDWPCKPCGATGILWAY